jgi:membrane fusion protein, heavy metal efflux system
LSRRSTLILLTRTRVLCLMFAMLVATGVLGYYWSTLHRVPAAVTNGTLTTAVLSRTPIFHPSLAQWAALTIEPVKQISFSAERITEGKIAVNESNSTPIFSPYSGRVTKLLARVGDSVTRGQPLLSIEATELVQAQNDFIAAATNLNKARSQSSLAQTVEKRSKELQQAKAVPLKEWEQAQAALLAAQNDLRSAETALQAARNRLRLIGRSDEEISAFQDKGGMGVEITINAPLDGTVVQRKVGHGQYISAASSDPVFVIGDLSTVWLLAYVREMDAPQAHHGQELTFRLLAFPEREFTAKITYVAPALEPGSRRLLIRATIDNARGLLKPEMFALVRIRIGETEPLTAVPQEAIIGEGSDARVWVVRDDKALESRRIRLGSAHGSLVEVMDGLSAGERVVTQGRVLVERAATGS